MFHTFARLAVVLTFATAATAVASPSQAEYEPPLVLWSGDSGEGFLVNAAVLRRTEGGYRYVAGKQNTHLTITRLEDGRLLFVDTGTRELRELPRTCDRRAVSTGVAAVCRIPAAFQEGEIYLEVWPRLGNDFVDGSTLSAKFRLWVLTDWGSDTVHSGAGRDFVNGAKGLDRVWAGAGDDWIRTGPGNDRIWGEDGDDELVGVEDDDYIHGGDGNDRVMGGPGADSLWGDAGKDLLGCADGSDNAFFDLLDLLRKCESETEV